MDEHPRKIILDFRMLLVPTLLCCCFVAFRVLLAGITGYVFLIWNIVLAWIPLLCAVAAEHFHTGKKQNFWCWFMSGLWLIFFPNAPYIVTDFVHLKPWASIGVPFWFDFMMLTVFAVTGILLGLCSLQIMRRVTVARVGAFWSWLFMVIISLLAGFGIYLGRYLRWNSWDVVANPQELLQDIGNRLTQPLSYPQTWFISMLFAALLLSSYLVFSHFCDYRHRRKS